MSQDTQQRVRDYFQVKKKQLTAMAELPVCEHPGLVGGHREELHRIYLREILPRRFEVGRGMVYGLMHRSREADIVIWDAQNFPSLPMLDHSFFFAESVRMVLESKSRWSGAQFDDVLEKVEAVRDILAVPHPSLDDDIAMLQLEVASIRSGNPHEGMMIAKPHIGTAALFLSGGSDGVQPASLDDAMIEKIDDRWPDLVLLLEPGRLIVKEYGEGTGALMFYELGEDALAAFTAGLFTLLNDRSVHTHAPLDLEYYLSEVSSIPPVGHVPFRLTRPASGRTPLWRDPHA